MKLATSTVDFGKFPMTDIEKVQALYDAGFRYIDLSMYNGTTADWPYLEPDWEDEVDQLKQHANDLGMTFVQAHSPAGNPLIFNEDYDRLVTRTIRSIEVCSKLGIKNTVIHTGSREDILYNAEDEKRYFKENMPFLQALFPVMEKHNINVLIENSAKANMYKKYHFFTGDEMRRFLEYANHPLLHACWDTGHGNLEGNQYQSILDLGNELRAVHIHDNRSGYDDHILPFMGSINMDEIMCALIDSGYQGYFTFECDNYYPEPNFWRSRRKAFSRETRLLNVPFALQLEMEKVLYKTGEYILNAYQCFEV